METSSPSSLKVLIAVPHFPPTHVAGVEQFAYRIASGLIQRGHSVQVICVESIDDAASGGKLRWSDEVFDEIPVRRLYYDQKSFGGLSPLSFGNPVIESHISEWIGANRPTLVHLISGYLIGISPLRAAKRFGIPTVVSLNDFWFLCPTVNLLRGDGSLCSGPSPLECARCLYDIKRRYRLVDRRAPGLVRAFWRWSSTHPRVGSRFGLPLRLAQLANRREQLKAALDETDVVAPITRFLGNVYAANGIDSARFVHTPLGISAHSAPAQRRSATDIHFGYLGQVSAIKGVDVLVRAFRQLAPTRPARLTIHGGMNPESSYAQHLRRLAGNDSRIAFAGHYDNKLVIQILSDVDAVVVPSVCYENSPTVALEAFAAGRPVIGTNVGGISEIVQDNVNGLLFERGDATDLASQMQRIIDDPPLLSRLKQGITRVPTAEEELQRYLAVYQRALSIDLRYSNFRV